MKTVTVKFSSTAPARNWIGQSVVCTNPEQLVRAIRTTPHFCHYFDENNKGISYLDDAIMHLGIELKNLTKFKEEHGFFTL